VVGGAFRAWALLTKVIPEAPLRRALAIGGRRRA
jgi:hypothetical protein